MTDIINMPTLGTTESGGEIKLRRPLRDRNGSVPAEIVLCHLPHNAITPFATWQRNTDTGSSYWGHYHRADEAAEAIADFNKRGN